MLRRALAALPIGPNEQKRIDNEALDENGFVTKLERLLLAVDGSPAGNFTARIAGLVAGAYGMPLTIVRLEDRPDAVEPADGPSRQVREGAKASAALMREKEAEPNPDKVHLTTRIVGQNSEEAIAEEARKGFDLMMIGVEKTHGVEGAFDPQISRLTKDFKGPIAILALADGAGVPVLNSELRVLVPINGTPAARRAAEIAFVIARPTGAKLTALYVSADDKRAGTRSDTRTREEAALKDIAELGERYDVQLQTALQSRSGAENVILRRAASGYGLIVMGVSQRPGEQLYFGNAANAILKSWKGAVLFVAT